MLLRDTNMQSFYDRVKKRGIACVGIGADFRKMLENYSDLDWDNIIKVLIDNSRDKQGRQIKIQKKSMEVKPLDAAVGKIAGSGLAVLISCTYFYEIFCQMNQMTKLDTCECYIYCFMLNKQCGESIQINNHGTDYRIPAKLHYCWFGGGKMPDLYKRCIDSWHRYCKGYEIIEWNESNCNLDENLYAKQAYEQQRYGFVPDYFRLKIIYEQGGIYLDTDVELLKNPDALRLNEAFCGLELPGEVALGLGFGAVLRQKMIGELLRSYESRVFIDESGAINDTPSPFYQTEIFAKKGMKAGNKAQLVEGVTIYPTWVLSPVNLFTNRLELSEETIAIHHFDGSWVREDRLARKEKRLREANELYDIIRRQGKGFDR